MPRPTMDVVIAWTFATVPPAMRPNFTRPTAIVDLETPANRKYREQLGSMGWPYPIRDIIRRRVKLPEGYAVGRIALIGFSESCTGVRILLSSKDGLLVDTVIACDGIHAGFLGGEPNKDRSNVDPAGLAPWIAYAELAAKPAGETDADPPGQRHCIITHSSIGDQLYPPYKFASTTRTAGIILNTVFGQTWPQAQIPGGVMYVEEQPPYVAPAGTLPGGQSYPRTVYSYSPDKYTIGDNGLAVLGFNNMDPTGVGDHKYQAQRVLPRVIQRMLIDRWNDEDPSVGVCATGVVSAVSPGVPSTPPPGTNCYNPGGVTVPPGVIDSGTDYSLNWRKYVPPGTPAPGPGPDGEQQSKYQQPGMTFWQGAASLALGLFSGVVGFKVVQQVRDRLRT